MKQYPTLIQGGMGVGVSGWRLARAVSAAGHLGVVSGTAIAPVVARRLQMGDPGGHIRRALAHFPIPGMARRVLDRYFRTDAVQPGETYRSTPMFPVHPSADATELTLCANFAEVWLAREGHDGPVGINYLEKLQIPHLVSIYGAMLAGVAYVLMGAGIPTQIPGSIDQLANHAPASYRLHVDGARTEDDYRFQFDPGSFWETTPAPLYRPRFLAIISSATLAAMLLTRASGKVDGFVVEAPTAGGHNAPPRGRTQLNERGEPIYGERDEVDFEKIRELGAPFWVAGSCASPHGMQEALAIGAQGIQVGTAFALCNESSMADALKTELLKRGYHGEMDVFTDPKASPSGFPFKVAVLPGTLSEQAVYEARPRVCDLGYMRRPYRRDDGTLGYRCAAEPVDQFVQKGGEQGSTDGVKCLCNALMANIGLGQTSRGYTELPLVTVGDDFSFLRALMKHEDDTYTARDVIDFLLPAEARAAAGRELGHVSQPEPVAVQC